jgi:hypothetical protein
MAVEGFYSNRETAKLLNLSVRQINNILSSMVIEEENLNMLYLMNLKKKFSS